MISIRRILLLVLLPAITGSSAAQDEPPDVTPEPVLVGPARLDLNTRAGDQSQRRTFSAPEPGTTITVDVAVAEGGTARSGFDLHLTYDPDRLAFQTAKSVDLFQDAFLMPALEPGSIALVGLLLGGYTPRSGGSVANITFTVLDTFPDGATVTLDHLVLGTALKIDSLLTGTESSVVTVGGATTTAALDKPDFDGDGTVGFVDFIIFAGAFGTTAGDQSFNPILDLDADGSVGFSDFLVFAQAFGT